MQGGRPPEIEVAIRPADLAAAGLSNTDVVQAIQTSNVVHSVGRIDREFKQYDVILNSERHSAADLEAIGEGRDQGKSQAE